MTIQISALDNGLRIVTDTMREAESVVVGAWVGVGTRHEPWGANGVAHMVEHMMFKGTKKRSAYGLSAEIENTGGSMNAHTTREETAYYAHVLPENTEMATDIIADMLQHSVFKLKELDRERQVIIQEIGRDLDSPEEYVFDLMQAQAFPKQKLGRPILGSAKVIARLPRRAIADYVHRYYCTANMVIVAVGRVEHASFVKMVRKRFSRLARGRPPTSEPARVAGGAKFAPKAIEQLHFILGFPGPNAYSRALYPTQLLSVLLGGSSASRLFQKVREKRGLVYTVSCGHMPFADSGLFQIYAGTHPERVRELIRVVCHEMRDVTRNVTPAELDRAKAQSRAELLMGQESVMRRADVIGHQMLAFGRTVPIEEIVNKLMAVTKKEVEAVAKKLIAKRPIVTALGPLGNIEDYRSIAERLK